jgi:hypothetical protein
MRTKSTPLHIISRALADGFESWQDAVGANAVWSVLQSELLGEGDDCRFGRLVGDFL